MFVKSRIYCISNEPTSTVVPATYNLSPWEGTRGIFVRQGRYQGSICPPGKAPGVYLSPREGTSGIFDKFTPDPKKGSTKFSKQMH